MHEVTIPALGMAMTEAVLTRWHLQPGDRVAAGDLIAEIETDKSNVDLESPGDGILGPHLVAEGDAVPIGEAVVRVLAEGESDDSTTEPTDPPEPAEPAEPVEPVEPVEPPPAADAAAPSTAAASVPAQAGERQPHALSPRRRRLARLEAEAEAFQAVTLEGGPTAAREAAAAAGSRATASTAAGASSASNGRRAGSHRAAIAQRVTQSWQSIPHFTVQREVDAGEADSVLARLRQVDPGATFTDLLLRAFAVGLGSVVPSDGDVGLAVATPGGVMMPVVSQVPDLPPSGLVTRRTAAVRRGRESRLSAYDLSSTPVGSLSNLRSVDAFTGIIPLGQQVLLTVGRVGARPYVSDGRLGVRTSVIATLNIDHRHLDGDQAAEVLVAFERELGALRAWVEGDQT